MISYITLIPGVGIAGPEVAFKKLVTRGGKIKILSAWQKRKLFHEKVYYVVDLQDPNIPHGVQIRIDLTRGNEGEGGALNKSVYEMIK